MRRERVLAPVRRIADVAAVGLHKPALRLILEQRHHDLPHHLFVHGGIFDRYQGFNAAVEVPRHPVGGRNEHLGFGRRQRVSIAETDDAAVFQEASDDALHPNVFGQAWNAWAQTAYAAHDEIDAHTGLARLVEAVGHSRT